MTLKKTGIAAAALAVAGLATAGIVASTGVALADPTTSPTTSASAGTNARGAGQQASQDTPVTGDEATKVGDAVKAKDSAVTVTSVQKDPDGSYDVLGTKDGANVMFDVSADLATITQNAGGAGGGKGGGKGGGTHTAVTGDEATKVGAAVTAKDSAVTVTSVQKDAYGSYDVFGTKAGANVMFDVSADLATVTQNTGGPGGGKGGPGGGTHTAVTGDEAAKVTAAVTAKDSAVTVTSVEKDADGSYDVHGTKAGANVHFDVSADLATVTQAAGR
ncbi:MAG: hypothetical protein WAV45_04770 [Propionibacteriaceae bacterium]